MDLSTRVADRPCSEFITMSERNTNRMRRYRTIVGTVSMPYTRLRGYPCEKLRTQAKDAIDAVV